ncbi:signal transduction histidine kinase [hydrocarbon metagenome]|uniref:Signal transduction histidine kinase n=1 Tax=hydrocarbon metagenome TaxID=938273 RepID=A0A0W8E3S9_9ZZZZ
MDIKTEESSPRRTFHELAIESIHVGIMAVDYDGHLLAMNRAAEEMWELPRHEALGKSFLMALAEHDRARMKKTFDYVIRTGRTVSATDIVFENRAGKMLYINAYASPVNYSPDLGVGVAMWTEDITQERKLRMEVQRADKLAALGQLALGISHEVRTPLGTIKALASLIQMNISDPEQVKKYLKVMNNEVSRLDKLSRELLDFGGQKKLNMESVNVNNLINKLVYLGKLNRPDTKVNIEEYLQADLPDIYCDREDILHALMNLVINAYDAVGEEGTIYIETEQKGEWVDIRIKDTGPGIKADCMNKIFDPFYTTKENGTGLGLSIVHTIINDHGGHLDVDSQPGQGTVFTVKLLAEPREAVRP